MKDKTVLKLHNPTDMPDPVKIDSIEEPWIKSTIIVPDKYLGSILELCTAKRGIQETAIIYWITSLSYIQNFRLMKVVFDFYDRLKSITKGYASFDYEIIGYKKKMI